MQCIIPQCNPLYPFCFGLDFNNVLSGRTSYPVALILNWYKGSFTLSWQKINHDVIVIESTLKRCQVSALMIRKTTLTYNPDRKHLPVDCLPIEKIKKQYLFCEK